MFDILLHDHGDGSNTVIPILEDLYLQSRLKFPPEDFKVKPGQDPFKALVDFMQDPHSDIVLKFDIITRALRDPEALYLFAYNFVRERALQGIRYTEMRFAPQYSMKDKAGVPTGLKAAQILNCLVAGIHEAELFHKNIEVNIIASVGREVESAEAVDLVEAFASADRKYVVGIDLVCMEPDNPPSKHAAMFRKAKDLGFKLTCHAGEWVAEPPDFQKNIPLLNRNVLEAVELGVDRVGHATAISYDNYLLRLLADRGIAVEGCPGSNVTCGAVPDLACLQIRKILESGIKYSMSPDDDLFLPDINKTFRMCDDVYHFTPEEVALMRRNAIESRFGHRRHLFAK